MFPDDSIEAEINDLNKLFKLVRQYNLLLGQPSYTTNSFFEFNTTISTYSFLKYVKIVDPFCPVFQKEALKCCLEFFKISRSGCGIGALWAKLLGYPKDKIGVFDSIKVFHNKPTEYEMLERMGIKPEDELTLMLNKYNIVNYNMDVFATLSDDIKN